jgi:tRNA U34 5-methylaminomethyl-2-thiouridine-forming methyltransferase MnmC
VRTAVGAVAAAATFDLAARWMIGAAQKITGAIVSKITSSSSPQLTAAWFQQSFGPMAALGAALALLVTLIALTSAAARRDPAALAGTLAGIVRAGLGTGLVIALTTLAL